MAASCAAILTVYAAGYWRTRDEARRFGAETRPVRPAPALPAAPAAVASAPAEPAETVSAPPVPPSADARLPTKKKSSDAVTAPIPAPVPQAQPAEPAAPTVAAVPVEQTAAELDAELATEAPTALPTPPTGNWHDGYYTGWGQSFHGDIEAAVTIKDGRIVDAGVATCATRYPCYVIETILHQPDRQSPEVDRVSRATESTDAYYWGLVQALKKAEAGPAPASP